MSAIMMRFLFFCLCLSIIPEIAYAYYPEAEQIAAKVKRQYNSLHSFQAVITFEEDSALQLRLWQQNEHWRQEWVKKSGDRSGVIAAAIGIKDEYISTYPVQNPMPEPVLRFWQRKRPLIWWQEMGVDIKVKSYQFFKHRPCIVLGAKYNQLEAPQAWIDNEEMVPLRIHTARNVQWQWFKYHNLGNFFLPRKARIISSHGNTFTLNIAWRALNRTLPSTLFSQKAFEDKFANVVAPSSSFKSQLLQQLKLVLPLAEAVH